MVAPIKVSRAKPFEEGEYDVIIKSPLPNEYREDTKELIKTLNQNQPERDKDICVLNGSYRPNQDVLRYESTCFGNLAHHGTIEKKNRPKIFPNKEDIRPTSRQISNKPERDQQLFIGRFISNQDKPSYKQTCSRKIIHQGILDNWINVNQNSELEVIGLTSRKTGFRVSSAIGPKIELHSPTHLQSRPQTTWRMLMGLSWFQKAHKTENQATDIKVITQFPERVGLVQLKDNPRSNRFSNIQNYLWRPGETLNQSRESYNILPYTSNHRIRRIISPSILPHPGMTIFCVITPQRLGLCYNCNLSVDPVNQDVPRHHLFMPKLSRYKECRAYLE